MKRFKLYLFTGLLFLFACGSGNNEESGNKVDSSIVEIDASNSQNQINESSNEKQTTLDPKFAGFIEKFKKVSLPYKIQPEKELKYEKIPFEFQAQYLLKAENLNRNELEDMQSYAQFFYLSNPISTDQFNAIVYARSEMNSSYYILCTFDNSGKLISFMDFAMYQILGAGPQAGQEFEMSGSIDKNLKVTTVSDQETKNYQIQEDGKIVKK